MSIYNKSILIYEVVNLERWTASDRLRFEMVSVFVGRTENGENDNDSNVTTDRIWSLQIFVLQYGDIRWGQ